MVTVIYFSENPMSSATEQFPKSNLDIQMEYETSNILRKL